MLFHFNAHSSLLLPFVVPGAVATAWLLLRALRQGTLPDALLALLLAVPTLTITHWMLRYAGWGHAGAGGYTTALYYGPWQLNLFIGPAYFLYFRSLTNQEFRLRPRAWLHLLPGLVQLGLVAGAAGYDLLWLRGQGTAGPAVAALEALSRPLAWVQYGLLPAYCWRVLADYRRYTRYLSDNFSDTERLRFAGLRQLVLLQVLALLLSLLFEFLDWKFHLSDAASWNYFFLRGLLIYALIGVGMQANYAAATNPLRFDAVPDVAPAPEPAATLPPTLAAPVPEATPAADLSAALAPDLPPAPLAPELLAGRERLLLLMAEEQPWLEPELTLAELAKRLRTTPTLLSKVINTGCGQNFNDFVNTYRVQEAQRKLADPRLAHYSLVGVALESGFNSKSTFNRVFKKMTGRAPSEFTRPKS